MEVKEAIETRRSVRYYDNSKEISDEQLQELFRLVSLSPSSYNLQPWEFIIVRKKKNKEKLKNCAYGQQHVADASATIIVLGSLDPLANAEKVFNERIEKGYSNEEFKNSAISGLKKMSESREETIIWTTRSTCLAAMTLMLAAKDIGLATCPMEGFSPEKVKEAFGIPDNFLPLMLITLGYETKPSLQRLMRRPFKEIAHMEKF